MLATLNLYGIKENALALNFILNKTALNKNIYFHNHTNIILIKVQQGIMVKPFIKKSEARVFRLVSKSLDEPPLDSEKKSNSNPYVLHEITRKETTKVPLIYKCILMFLEFIYMLWLRRPTRR